MCQQVVRNDNLHGGLINAQLLRDDFEGLPHEVGRLLAVLTAENHP